MSENNNKPKSNMPRFNLSWLYMFIAMTIAYLYFTSDDNAGINRQLTYTEFKNMVNQGYASKIIAYNDNTVDMFVKPEHVKDVFKDDYKKVGRSPSMHVEVGSIDALDSFWKRPKKKDTLPVKSAMKRNRISLVHSSGTSLLSSSSLPFGFSS